MNEITFKFKEKKFKIVFDYNVKNKEIYEKVAQELKMDPQKISLMNIKNNNESEAYIHETILVELIDEGIKDENLSQRQRSGYVGLMNNDSYYLNCILQSLFMIVPFRNLVYSWSWKDYYEGRRDKPKKMLKESSPMRQLQYLFTSLERMNTKHIDAQEYFVEKIKRLSTSFPSDYFSGILQACLQDYQGTNLSSTFLEMFCLRVETNSHKNFASIDLDHNKFSFEDGLIQFFNNVQKFITFPSYLFIFPQRFVKEYGHIGKNTNQSIYPLNFNMKEVLKRGSNNDVNYELIQVCHHTGNYWSNDNFGLVVKNELNDQWVHFNDKLTYLTSKEECLSFFSDNSGDKDSAVYLVYRKVDKTPINLMKIPQKLLEDTKKEEVKKQERILEKNRRRDYSTISIYLGNVKDEKKPWRLEVSENYQNVSFSRSGDVSSIAKCAAIAWKIDEKENTFRIRKYNTKYKVAVDCYRENETFMMSNISTTDNLVLEVYPEPNHKWSETKTTSYILGLITYNKENNTFTPLEYIPFEIHLQFTDLKEKLQKITGISSNNMKIYYETTHDTQEKELNFPNKSLRETPLFDGHKLYVEDFDPSQQYSPLLLELENVKNQTEIFYNSQISQESNFDKVSYDKSVKIDKRVSVYDLLQLIALETGIEVEELKIYNIFERDRERVIAEIRNVSQSLTEIVKSKSSATLYLEKSKNYVLPEVVLTFYHYQPKVFDYLESKPFDDFKEIENHNLKQKLYSEAFELNVRCDIPIINLRKLVFEQLDSLKLDKPSSHLFIRLREIYAQCPSNIFPNNDLLTLSECSDNILYHGKTIAFQILDSEEPVVSKKFVVPVIQRWNPSTFTFGPRTEFLLDREMPVEELRNLISKKFNIQNVGLAKSSKLEIFHSDMNDLIWDPKVPLFVANKKIKFATLCSSPFFLSDGQVLFFRDNSENKLSLGPKEKTKLELFLKNHKAISYVTKKEKNKK